MLKRVFSLSGLCGLETVADRVARERMQRMVGSPGTRRRTTVPARFIAPPAARNSLCGPGSALRSAAATASTADGATVQLCLHAVVLEVGGQSHVLLDSSDMLRLTAADRDQQSPVNIGIRLMERRPREPMVADLSQMAVSSCDAV